MYPNLINWNMIKKQAIGMILLGGVVLSGCSLVAQPADVETESPRQEIKGTLIVKGGKFILVSDKQNIDLESRKVDLKTFDGKEITVIGEYSGTTLYVDEVK